MSKKSTEYIGKNRKIKKAKAGDTNLEPYTWLPEGIWTNDNHYGWNMIALPFVDKRKKGEVDKKSRGYRLLVNKYTEQLKFTHIDDKVPNRGVEPHNGMFKETDQEILTLDYEQKIRQLEAKDFPKSGKAGGPGIDIHHEPGLFLKMKNFASSTIQRKPTIENIELNLARLGTIPHGDSLLALGAYTILKYTKKNKDKWDGKDKLISFLQIPKFSFNIGLPIGTTQDLKESDYLQPYRKLKTDEFDPAVPQETLFNDLVKATGIDLNDFDNFPIHKTTRFWFDTEFETAGILNIPFVTRQANAASMRSTFWIHELGDPKNPTLVMQYLQTVLLDFHIIRSDDLPGRIRWPHISLNTLVKKAEKKVKDYYEEDED